jgi:hypothetical protein
MHPPRLPLIFITLALLSPALAQSSGPSSIPAVPAKPAAAAVPGVSAAVTREAVLRRGRQLVAWFYAQNLEPVWAAFLPDARSNFGDDLKIFQAYRAGGVTTYGKESRLLSEDVQEQGGVMFYLRTATFERGPRVQWTVAFGLDAVGRVVSFGILGGSEPAPDKQAVLGTGL